MSLLCFGATPCRLMGGQQKQQAVDAGRDGEGQEVMAEFAGEAEYHNAEKLENKIHFGYLLCVEMNGGPSGKMGAQKPPSGVWRKRVPTAAVDDLFVRNLISRERESAK